MEHPSLEPLRRLGIRAITIFIVANAVVTLPIGLLMRHSDAFLCSLLGVAAAAPACWCYVQRRTDAAARMVYALSLNLFPILFVYLFHGDPWQMDMHMYFFVCFSMMLLLCDTRPIIAAAAVTIVHHFVFFLWMPNWVFPGSGSIPRVLLHGGLVGLEVAILITSVRIISNLTLANAQEKETAETARLAAEKAQKDAEIALSQQRHAEALAVQERRERQAAEAALRAASEGRRSVTADEIEAGIGALVAELNVIAGDVVRQSADITNISRTLSNEAGQLRASSESAVGSISGVASNSDELVDSIHTIGENAEAAQEVALTASQSITTLTQGVRTLVDEVDAAQGILNMVSEIAGRSNLLALNATIEAARSGEAGRGFAVVAAEMKQMAQITARAADDIASRLSSIGGATASFGEKIDRASTDMGAIATNSTAIASAVQQQQVATRAIADSAEDMLAKVQDTDMRSRALSTIAGDSGDIAAQTEALAEKLKEQARQLSGRMDSLMKDLRAA